MHFQVINILMGAHYFEFLFRSVKEDGFLFCDAGGFYFIPRE